MKLWRLGKVPDASSLRSIRTKRDIGGDAFTLLANRLGLPPVDLTDLVKQVADPDRAAVHEVWPRPIIELYVDDVRFIKAHVNGMRTISVPLPLY